ncbi:MAG: hypothetical protein E6R13_01280 [Spirochaetes bacterium]|nr:MAG: hypothetical protein E6R13_01280 [Spirochaetota bacterium]
MKNVNNVLTKYNISLDEFERYIADMAEAMALPVTYNIEQNNNNYIVLAESINNLHKTFLNFYIMNAKGSGKVLREELDKLINTIKEIQRNTLLTEISREEHGFVKSDSK